MKKTAILVLLFVVPQLASAAQIFVSPEGKDANPGTRRQPLATLYEALSRAQPGDEVRLLPGTYTGTGSKIEDVNGAPEQPITIVSDSSNPEKYAVIDGEVELVNGVLPDGGQAKALENYGLYLRDSSWVTIRNIKFVRCWAYVLYLRDCSYITIDGVEMRSGWRTIYARGDDTHHILVENSIYDVDERIWSTWDWASLHHGVGGDPAGTYEMQHFNNQIIFPRDSGGSIVVRGNQIRNVFNAYRNKSGGAIQDNGNVEIYDNFISKVRDNVFEPETVIWNAHFYRNTLFNCRKPYSFDNVSGGYIYIWGNTQYQEENPILGPRTASDEDRQSISGIYKYYRTDPDNPPFEYPLYVFNNSIYTEATAFQELDGRIPNHMMRHFNNGYFFFKYGGFGLDYWDPSYEFDHDIANLPDWPASLITNGQEQHGILGDIKFVDPLDGVLTVRSDSPAIDAGKVITIPELGWTLDYKGRAPDIGAYEKGRRIDGPPFRYREPGGGEDTLGDGYLEKPRIVRHAIVAEDKLKLWFSYPLDPATVSPSSIKVVVEDDVVGIDAVTLTDDNYGLVIGLVITADDDEFEEDEEDEIALRFTTLPSGINGQPVTHWASTLPLAK